VRGDANGSGAIDLSDAVYMLMYLFGDGEPPHVWRSGDANDDDAITIADPIYLLNYLFAGRSQPDAPFPEPGCGD
jgi:hypothetical protein